MMPQIDTSILSKDQQLVWDEIMAGKNLFVTARAGAGKSFLIRFLSKFYPGRIILTAPTGIAANNISGRTLHSQFLINPRKMDPLESANNIAKSFSNRRTVIRMAAILIIDEVSMVSDRLLSCVDLICQQVRKNTQPFGGLQVVLFGDFLQLPPVFSGDSLNDNICWDSDSWQRADIKPLLITSNFRQKEDTTFYDLLSRLRYNKLTQDDVRDIYNRDQPVTDDSAIRIFSTNAEVDTYNYKKFNLLDENTERKFIAECEGDQKLIQNYWKDSIIPEELVLRKGARVMMCRNVDLGDDNYLFNGSLGTVVTYSEDGYPVVKFDQGITYTVDKAVIYEPEDYDATGKPYNACSISQVPLKLAYAVTVHKSQGQTFDSLYVDCSRLFLYGQAYTAFSRARTLDGLFVHGFNIRSIGVVSDPLMVNRYLKLEQEAAERNG